MFPLWHVPSALRVVESPPTGAPACWLQPSADVSAPAAPFWKYQLEVPAAVNLGIVCATRACGTSWCAATLTRIPISVSWSCAPRLPMTLSVHVPYVYEPCVRSTKNCDMPASAAGVLTPTVLPAASTSVSW